MIRYILPALLAATPAFSQDLGVCHNIPYSTGNCVRVLACVGDQGLWLDGKARGWDQGTVTALRNDNVVCQGTWDSNGPLGTGRSQIACQDGTSANVIYYNQDNLTGTVSGQGLDSKDRRIQVWTGENVLQFLTAPGAYGPALPCVAGDIPIS